MKFKKIYAMLILGAMLICNATPADGAVVYSCTEAELKDKLDSGEIINVGTEEKPEYARVNKDGTTTTLVETGTKTEENVETDVAVSDTSVSYVYDPETDTYTKVEKGTVTTTKTYSGVPLSSDEKFETREAAQAAAESAAETDAKNVAGDGAFVETNVDITEETTTTYTGSATYISAFSTTIDMSGIEKSSFSSGDTVAKDIQDNAIDSATAELWDKGYYVLESTGNVKVDKTKDNKIWADDYKTTGDSSITLTYAKFKSDDMKYSLWDDFKDLSQEDKNETKLAEEVKKKVEAEGSQFIKIEAIDWNLGTTICYYVPGNAVKVAEEQKSRDDAEKVLKDSADQAAEAGGTVDDQILRMVFGEKKVLENGTTACNVKTTTDEKSVTTYRYNGTYTAKTTQQEKEKEISKTSGYATALFYVPSTPDVPLAPSVTDNTCSSSSVSAEEEIVITYGFTADISDRDWVSEDPHIVTIDHGLIKGVKVGETTISTTDGTKRYKIVVKKNEFFGTYNQRVIHASYDDHGNLMIDIMAPSHIYRGSHRIVIDIRDADGKVVYRYLCKMPKINMDQKIVIKKTKSNKIIDLRNASFNLCDIN